jgi:hypothetical protein
MTETIFIVTIALLFLLLLLYYKQFGLKLLLHPGFYFAAIWLFSVPSQWLLMDNNIAFLPAPEHIDELTTLVGFTALCFILLTFWGKKKVRSRDSKLSFLNTGKYFKALVYITVIGAIVKLAHALIFLGASLNMGATRMAYTRDMQQVYRARSIFEILTSYANLFHPIVSILAGYYIGLKLLRIKTIVSSAWLLSLPFLVTILHAITIGGRNPVAIGIKFYLLGLAFAMPWHLSMKAKVRILGIAAIMAVFFGLFVTMAGSQRAQISDEELMTKQLESPLLVAFGGMFEYMGAHYWGYQLRREDTFNENNLGLGYHTFNGLFQLTLPFSSLFGFTGNIGNLFGYQESPLSYAALHQADKPAYFTTYSLYAPMVCDFGIPGSYLFIIFFTIYTHWLFLRLFSKKHRTALSLFLFYLNFEYWASSNFQSRYGDSIVAPFLVFFLFDLLQSLFFETSRPRIASSQSGKLSLS